MSAEICVAGGGAYQH